MDNNQTGHFGCDPVDLKWGNPCLDSMEWSKRGRGAKGMEKRKEKGERGDE